MFSKPEIPCPAAGCGARLTKDDLRANKDLENRVKAHARRERERAAEEERDQVDITIDDDDDDY